MFYHSIIFAKQGRSHRPSPPWGRILGFLAVLLGFRCLNWARGPLNHGPRIAGQIAGRREHRASSIEHRASSIEPRLPGRRGQRFANRDAWATVQPIRFSPHGEGGLGPDSLFKTESPGQKKTRRESFPAGWLMLCGLDQAASNSTAARCAFAFNFPPVPSPSRLDAMLNDAPRFLIGWWSACHVTVLNAPHKVPRVDSIS